MNYEENNESQKQDPAKGFLKILKLFIHPTKGTIIWTTIIGVLVVSVFGAVLMLFSDDNVECNTQDANSESNTGAMSGDEKANAQEVFDLLTKANGFSGTGAAGAVAVAKRESNLNWTAINRSGGVAGIFQWSGFTNQINGDRITKEGSIKMNDMSTLTKENIKKLITYELQHSYKDVAILVGNESDPGKAATEWSEKYEGIDASDSGQAKTAKIIQWAKEFNTQLNADNIPANPAILASTTAASDGENSGSSADKNDCHNAQGSGADGYALPVKGDYSLGLGTYPSYTEGGYGHDHNGVDFRSPHLTEEIVTGDGKGAEVYSVHNGKVVNVNHVGDQYIVVIKNDDGLYSYYGHSMIKPVVKAGDTVSQGQLITYQGYGGDVRPKTVGAAHVHFGMGSSPSGFGPNSNTILSPADYLPLPTEVLPDGTSGGSNDRVTGSGFTKYFNAKDKNAKPVSEDKASSSEK